MSGNDTLIGLIGANIGKSLSPALHETALAAAGRRGLYHLMDLDVLVGRDLRALFEAARTAGFAGLNITFPCKQAVIPLLDDLSADAAETGAFNTVVFDGAGRATGYNTDRLGFRASFRDGLGEAAVAGRGAVVVGAGGAGRAIAFALKDLGAAEVVVHDTDVARRDGLMADLRRRFGPAAARVADDLAAEISRASGVANATPIGMTGIAGNPVPEGVLRADQWAADAIYTPIRTAFLIEAAGRGARTLDGGGMCVHQAADAFRLFTGLEVDLASMRATFLEAQARRDGNIRSS